MEKREYQSSQLDVSVILLPYWCGGPVEQRLTPVINKDEVSAETEDLISHGSFQLAMSNLLLLD